MTYVAPEFRKSAFNCSHCGAFAQMSWDGLCHYLYGHRVSTPLDVSHCSHCEKLSYWIEDPHSEGSDPVSGRMLIPSGSSATLPHPEMPETVLVDYTEAREICGASPRAAAALLRLSIQKLCKELGESGKNINNDIANLVSKGLPSQIQQALDIIREGWGRPFYFSI